MKKFIAALSIVAITSLTASAQDDPFAEMEKFMQAQIQQMRVMHEQMSRYFDSLNKGIGTVGISTMPVSFSSGAIMSSGFEDKGDHYELKIKIDDLKNSKVQMSISGNLLTINVEEHKKEEKKDKNMQLISYSNRNYSQSYTLPPNVNVDKIDAAQKDDMIIVSIPKKNPPKEVKIRKIDSNSTNK